MLPLTTVPALLLSAAVKGAVLVIVAALVIALLRIRSATSRHAFWTAVVLAHLALPALVAIVPAWHVPLPRQAAALLSAIDRRASSDERVPAFDAIAAPSSPMGVLAPIESRRGFASMRAARARAHVVVPGPDDRTPHVDRVVVSVEDAPLTVIVGAPGDAHVSSGTAWLTGSSTWVGPMLFAIWIVGALVVLVRLAIGTTRVAMLARDATRVIDGEWLSVLNWLAREVGITRPVTLLRGNELLVPVTWGVVYPKILLPVDADEWTAERKRFVLLHELAHVRRLDAFTQLLAQFALALFWFDPFLWYAVHRMRIEREHACDDLVIRHGAVPSRYAGDLLALVQTIGATRSEGVPAFATLAMARRHDFEGRMLSILDPDPDRRPFTLRRGFSLAVVAVLLVVPLSAMRPYESSGDGWRVGLPEMPVVPEIPVMSETSGLPETSAMPELARVPAPYPIPILVAATPFENCELLDGSGSQTSVQSNSNDEEYQKLRYLKRERSRCTLVTLEGRVEFSDDDRDIVWLSRGGRATFDERTRDGLWRSLTISERGGGLERTYLENGEAATFDMDARAWMHEMVLEAIRETGYRAAARVERIRRDSGVQGVLAEISRIGSTGAKRAYFTALLDQPKLSDRDLEATIRQAGQELESSGDLSAVIAKVPVSGARAGAREALAAALERIESDGDKANAIARLVANGERDRELLLVALRTVRTIESDGDASRVLVLMAPVVLATGDDSLRAEFFRAVRTIESDGDARRVLSVAIQEDRGSPELTLDLIRSARRIESDGDKASVLGQIASANLLSGKELTQEFLDAARSIESDGDYRRVMDAMRARRP